jgi:hypothetical protein
VPDTYYCSSIKHYRIEFKIVKQEEYNYYGISSKLHLADPLKPVREVKKISLLL